MKKVMYWILLGLGLAIMLFYSVVLILKSYTDIGMSSWFFKQPQTRLIIATLYTVAVIMVKSQVFRRR